MKPKLYCFEKVTPLIFVIFMSSQHKYRELDVVALFVLS